MPIRIPGENENPVIPDDRIDFIQDFTQRALRLKPDKWARMMISDEARTFITSFVDRAHPGVSTRTLSLPFLSSRSE